jgi:hypothetical protein
MHNFIYILKFLRYGLDLTVQTIEFMKNGFKGFIIKYKWFIADYNNYNEIKKMVLHHIF